MKKFLIIILTLSLFMSAAGLLSIEVAAEEIPDDVPINDTYFPDPEFDHFCLVSLTELTGF
ncbi:MAG: hypothetical protein LBH71_02230 [Oscillospiraceae bacterium]|jgi:hypothetical protein|nr:hypothetical protein [Oscillospiraceae bacterium]